MLFYISVYRYSSSVYDKESVVTMNGINSSNQ